MGKYTIKETYGTDELPELFCGIGAILRLKEDFTLHQFKKESRGIEKIGHALEGTLFEVRNIVEYGFDLISLDSRKIETRFINSSMPEYFEILPSSHS